MIITEFSPYVYHGVNRITQEIYVGVRYAHSKHNRTPAQDLGHKYFTSSKVVKEQFDQFDWQVLAQFATKEDALAFEDKLIREYWNNPLLLNKNRGGKKFHRPDIYVRRPKKIANRSESVKACWADPEFRNKMCAIRQVTHTTEEFKKNHSVVMSRASAESKLVRRVCRIADKKEMTVQNFFRYLKD